MNSTIYSLVFPESAFCVDDRPARDTILELWADGNETYCLLRSLMDSDAQIAYSFLKIGETK